jgi:hypothetical protein
MHRHPKQQSPQTQPIDPKVLDAASGEWWRFERYEIRDGAIQPARGAHLEWYDPWASFRETKKYKDAASPYQGLLQLVAQFEFTSPGRLSSLNHVSQKAIVDWCQTNGPLGILLARWESLRLAPQPSGDVDFVSLRYVRAYGQVIATILSQGSDVGAWKPNVLLHGLNDVELVEESPEKTWRQFFPTVPRARANTYQYPRPYTEEFCRVYAEPVFDFVVAARLFAGAVKRLAEHKKDPQAEEHALETMNVLRRPISAIVDRTSKGDLKQLWQTPSLLASFAEMFAQDIAFGRVIRLCQCCQLPFVSAAYQGRYCSPNCRQRQQKRNVRQKAKQARSLRAQGQTTRQIASALGEDLRLVKGWLAKA